MRNRLATMLAVALVSVLVPFGCLEQREGCQYTSSCPPQGEGGTGGAPSATGGASGEAGFGGGNACAETCEGATPHCDEESGQCVECLESDDCTDATAPRCEGGACVGCAENADCSPFAGTELCHVQSGGCVECLPGEHESCGTGFLCHGELRECVEVAAGSAPTCQPCVADAHCQPGFYCVAPNRFGEEGYFCLPEPNPGCVTRRPFVQDLDDLVTIDGDTVTVCGHAFTSCAGFNHFRTAVDGCSEASDPPPGEGNAACGLPGTVDNTRCRPFSTEARCSYRCGSIDDCLCGFDCVDQVCGFSANMEQCD